MKKGIKIMVITVCVLAAIFFTFVLLDGTFVKKTYQSVWSDEYVDNIEDDVEQMVAYAIRASSSHNTQPWLVKRVDEQTVTLYADMRKSLPVVDGDNRQLLMSQGTFIECFVTGAAKHGYDTQVTYAEPQMNEEMPLIATIKIENTRKSKPVDVVSSSTIDVDVGASADLIYELDAAIQMYDQFSYSLIESAEEVDALQEFLLKGTVIESEHEPAVKELLNVFRWTEYEKNEYGYGLSLTSMPGIMKPFIQPIMKMTSGNWQSFGQSGIKLFKDRLAKETQYILIRCNQPDQIDYVSSGRIYQKLLNNTKGYSIKPAMQVLENFDVMQDLNEQFAQAYGDGTEVMMVLGVQASSGSAAGNPRHLVGDILTGE